MGQFYAKPTESLATEQFVYFTVAQVARVQRKQEDLETEVKVLRSQLMYADRKYKQCATLSPYSNFFDKKQEQVQCIQQLTGGPTVLITRILQYIEDNLFNHMHKT